ncbi:unnamed protein product [Brassica oleracea var. botrytis]
MHLLKLINILVTQTESTCKRRQNPEPKKNTKIYIIHVYT